MKYLIKFSYDGSKFNGFQRLSSGGSVQGEIERALSVINKGRVSIKGAGRTDRGVHAYNQAAHFELDVDVPVERISEAINSLVGPYICVNDAYAVSESFHARFSVVKKVYEYKLYLGKYEPMLYDYYEEYDGELDFDAMRACLKLFEGVHNFRNFVAGSRDNYEAIIYDAQMKVDGDYLTLRFVGKSFYRYMVRHLVGAVIEVGRKKRTIDEVEEALVNFEKEQHFGVASAKGLYLVDVFYDEV